MNFYAVTILYFAAAVLLVSVVKGRLARPRELPAVLLVTAGLLLVFKLAAYLPS